MKRLKTFTVWGIPLAITFTCLFSGCLKRHYPDVYENPQTALEIHQQEALSEAPFIPGEWPNTHWWRMFNDCQLDKLMREALSQNPSVHLVLPLHKPRSTLIASIRLTFGSKI